MVHDIITTLLYAVFSFCAHTLTSNFKGASILAYRTLLASQVVGFLLFIGCIIGLFMAYPWYVGLIVLIVAPNVAIMCSNLLPLPMRIIAGYMTWILLIVNIIWAICNIEYVQY